MAFIGNIVAAYAAQQIGEYNAQLYNQQAAFAKAKAEQGRVAYNQLDRPRLLKSQASHYSNYYVSRAVSGAQLGRGSPYASLLEFQVNQHTDLAIADYNETVDYTDMQNQSILLTAKGRGERFRGRMTAGVELGKAGGSLLQWVSGSN